MTRRTWRILLFIISIAAAGPLGCDDGPDDTEDSGTRLEDGGGRRDSGQQPPMDAGQRVDAGQRIDGGRMDSGLDGGTDSGLIVADSGADSGLDGGGTDDAGLDGGEADGGPVCTEIPPAEPLSVFVPRRGGTYFGFRERFNRYYTDANWRPLRTVYVSADGTGDGSSRVTPADALLAANFALPGTMIVYLAGTYDNYSVTFTGVEQSGTYNQPIVLRAERGLAGEYLVHLNCVPFSTDATMPTRCFNFDRADYIALDGFEIQGGNHGVRAGVSLPPAPPSEIRPHAVGIAVLNSRLYSQQNNALRAEQVDWAVWEGNDISASQASASVNFLFGGDWHIYRHNEVYATRRADFQIAAEPMEVCPDPTAEACYGWAGEGAGGGAGSDYYLIENNYHHHGTDRGQGANFSTLRRTIIRNNIFGPYVRHGQSFYQTGMDPRYGSRENKIYHNIFFATNASRHMLQFINQSAANDIRNNIFVSTFVTTPTASALWVTTDASTVADNVFSENVYIQGSFAGADTGLPARTAHCTEMVLPTLDASWFTGLPTLTPLARDPAAYIPTATAPFANFSARLDVQAPLDRDAIERADPTDPGPFEVP